MKNPRDFNGVLPSRLKKAPKSLAHLLMREIFTAFKRILAPLHGFRKAVFFVEVTRHNLLHKLIGLASLLGRALRQSGFEMGVEMYFHTLQDTEKSACGQEYWMAAW